MPDSIKALLLAAGFGARLRPLTDGWPKCLMPINGRPLLEYWLDTARQLGIANVLVNTHYLADKVHFFLRRPRFKQWVRGVYEPELKGTAGALRANAEALRYATVFLVHADNFCICDFDALLKYHQSSRPKHCLMTMMTFYTRNPSTCGIVELDADGVVIGFHEKVRNPPGNLANGAVYLLEPEVIDWICDRSWVSDFSNDVIPNFIGRIATWHNDGTHIDIGSIEALREAQAAVSQKARAANEPNDDWSLEFASHPIHTRIQYGIPPRV